MLVIYHALQNSGECDGNKYDQRYALDRASVVYFLPELGP